MRGDFTLFILKAIRGGVTTIDVIAEGISSYSISNTNRRFWGGMPKNYVRKPIFEKQIAILEMKKRIAKTIIKLKSQGFVSKKKKGFLNITKSGLSKLLKLETLKNFRPNYVVQKSDEIKIITFDIPESRKMDRYWLRWALKNLKFNFLQKSVWVGKSAIPKDFLEDLREKGIFDFVEIFAVTKSGTLRPIQ